VQLGSTRQVQLGARARRNEQKQQRVHAFGS
jgi:hypothetical protein